MALSFVVSAGMTAPAAAQGFFDLLFGGFRRAAPAPAPSYADPRHDGRHDRRDDRRDDDNYPYYQSDSAGGPGVAYCVRLCDGRHFPINYRSGVSPADLCRSFCPAAQTQIFSGSGIGHAVSSNGRRYSELPNAFVYRDKLVDGCTCDGKSPTGLVRQDVEDDPTLRPGDIVATGHGLMAYRGEGRSQTAQFTPISSVPGLSAKLKQQLTATRVAPGRSAAETPDPEADGETPVTSRNVNQRSQASR